jgi:hypothetical protein
MRCGGRCFHWGSCATLWLHAAVFSAKRRKRSLALCSWQNFVCSTAARTVGSGSCRRNSASGVSAFCLAKNSEHNLCRTCCQLCAPCVSQVMFHDVRGVRRTSA